MLKEVDVPVSGNETDGETVCHAHRPRIKRCCGDDEMGRPENNRPKRNDSDTPPAVQVGFRYKKTVFGISRY